DGFKHHERDGHSSGGRNFAGAGLDEIAAGLHGDFAGEADVVVGDEFAGFENHLQMRRAAGLLRGGDFVEHFRVVAGEKAATVNDHVNFIRAIGHGAADFFELRAQRILSAGKSGGDGGDVHGRHVAEKFARVFHHVGINAN